MFQGKRLTQVVDYDVWYDENNKDHWDIENQQPIDEAMNDFIKSEERALERSLTFEETKILIKFSMYLQKR